MRRRILLAIVGVTVLATTVLTVPLAVITARREADASARELEQIADRAAAALPTALGADGDPIELPDVESDVELAVYLPDGTRLVGTGPEVADSITSQAEGAPSSGTADRMRVLAEPIIVDERQIAVVRVAEPLAQSDGRLRRELLVLLAIDLAAVLIAVGIGWVVAARLARPVRQIRDDAVRLGQGDFSIDPHRSGVTELDETADALAETADRLGTMLARERAFSADASHQLRTPLAALRLSIETELMDPRPDATAALHEAVSEIDRLENTVATLLDVARDRLPQRELLDVDDLLSDVRRRWQRPLQAADRSLRCSTSGRISARVSKAVIDQVLDILVSNALEHGAGPVSVSVTQVGGNLIVTISDGGRLERDIAELFTRRDPGAAGHGVGLALARSLAEAEGGRLVVGSTEPTTFLLVVPG
jgi:signal transduction histidine kinase